MKGDDKVIEYLNAALRSELTAVSQYWLHYRLQEDWGHPNLQKLDALRIGETVKECLESDLAAEHEARTLYIEARNHCDQVGDYVSKNLFEELIADEEGHIDFLETQLSLQAELGEAVYGQLQAKPTDDSK